jgi:hypothetical protein
MTPVHAYAQAYLETDPAARTTKDEYVMRYQRFARDELEQAIGKYHELCSTLGGCAAVACRLQGIAAAHCNPVHLNMHCRRGRGEAVEAR